MWTAFTPLFPGMLLDATVRFAQDQTASPTTREPIRDMGWNCTLVTEALGGVGGNLSDLASIMEALATYGMQLPIIEACVVVPLMLEAEPADSATRWLEMMCNGNATIMPLIAMSAPLEDIAVEARPLSIGFELSGEILGVDFSQDTSHYIVPVRLYGTDCLALFVVAREQMPAPTAVYRTMEGRRAADFTISHLTLPATACIAQGEAAALSISRANDAALMLTAVDTVAALAALIEQTANYLKDRRQFGVALSTFQALRHRAADMYVRYLAARGLLMHAFSEYERLAPDLSRTLCLMKVSLAETARTCAEGAIQMHGGMGMSEEVLATRLAQRLLTSEFHFGDRLLYSARLC